MFMYQVVVIRYVKKTTPNRKKNFFITACLMYNDLYEKIKK